MVDKGEITIDPFHPSRLGPNSYNLRLAPELIEYSPGIDRFDLKAEPSEGTSIVMDEKGYELRPGMFYLGRTIETTGTDCFVPLLEGRSSIARQGITVHCSAGVGDLGFCGTWTLEITCVIPVRIYPNIEVCQLMYFEPSGMVDRLYRGKYQGQILPQSSRLYTELTK